MHNSLVELVDQNAFHNLTNWHKLLKTVKETVLIYDDWYWLWINTVRKKIIVSLLPKLLIVSNLLGELKMHFFKIKKILKHFKEGKKSENKFQTVFISKLNK